MEKTIDSVDYETQRTVFMQILMRLGNLSDEEVYTVPEILGQDFWEEADPDSHADMEIAFAGFVAGRRFAFEPQAGGRKYRYISSKWDKEMQYIDKYLT